MVTKLKLLELADTLYQNYKQYQKDKSQTTLLKKNTEAFEATVPHFSKVKRLMASVAAMELPAYIEPILLAAESYEALALEHITELTTYHPLLDQANACYQLIQTIISPISPASMTPSLSDIELSARFSSLKMAYLKLVSESHAIEKQLQSDNAPDTVIYDRLQKIQTEISHFYQTLKKDYKKPEYKTVAKITDEFEAEVEQALQGVTSLLKTPKRKQAVETIESSTTDEGLFKKPDSIAKKKRPNQPAKPLSKEDMANILASLSFLGKPPEQENANTSQTARLS